MALIRQLPFIENDCGRMSTSVQVQQKFGVFDMAVAGWPLTYLVVETVLYFALAVGIDIMLSYPSIRAALFPDVDSPAARAAAAAMTGGEDADVIAEARRVDAATHG